MNQSSHANKEQKDIFRTKKSIKLQVHNLYKTHNISSQDIALPCDIIKKEGYKISLIPNSPEFSGINSFYQHNKNTVYVKNKSSSHVNWSLARMLYLITQQKEKGDIVDKTDTIDKTNQQHEPNLFAREFLIPTQNFKDTLFTYYPCNTKSRNIHTNCKAIKKLSNMYRVNTEVLTSKIFELYKENKI